MYRCIHPHIKKIGPLTDISLRCDDIGLRAGPGSKWQSSYELFKFNLYHYNILKIKKKKINHNKYRYNILLKNVKDFFIFPYVSNSQNSPPLQTLKQRLRGPCFLTQFRQWRPMVEAKLS